MIVEDSLAIRELGACPRIGNLLLKSHFGRIFRAFSLNSPTLPPQMHKKSDSNRLPLAMVSILGQTSSGGNYRIYRWQTLWETVDEEIGPIPEFKSDIVEPALLRKVRSWLYLG